MGKKRCDLSKKEYAEKVEKLSSPKFICKKCHRIAMKKSKLCKPKPI